MDPMDLAAAFADLPSYAMSRLFWVALAAAFVVTVFWIFTDK